MSEYMHTELADGRWMQMPLPVQLSNIGSEVSRAIRWKNKGNAERMTGAFDRALELTDLSIRWAQTPQGREENPGAIRELSRLREVMCDLFLGENEFGSDDVTMQRYFDQYAMIRQNVKRPTPDSNAAPGQG